MEIDCGDNSCAFATNKGGMRTNGGCRCFSNAGFSRSAVSAAHLMLPEVLRLRQALATVGNLIPNYTPEGIRLLDIINAALSSENPK